MELTPTSYIVLGLVDQLGEASPYDLKQAVARARRAAHARKLAEYEERRRLDPGTGARGVWLSLDAGIAHEREWVRFWSEIARGRRP